ncbi:MAG: Ig-like domain-containing protein, partial [Oscillospiraceae bacterium]|nr:Ig-like domain-containing protein [Oscillospiraceae bacterium]
IILALSMLAAFVPAVSAETATQPNFTINYDITGDLAATNAASFSAIDLNYTNGFYALGTAGFYGEWNTSSDYFKPYGTGENTNVAMRNALHSGVKVWVPMAGTYTLKVNYATGLAFSENEMRVFWHKETYDRSSSSRVGVYKSPAGSYSSTEIWSDQFVKIHSEPFTATVTADVPGYYYVGFEVGGSSSGQTSGMYQRASFASISLVSGNGDGNAIVLGSIAEPFELNTTDNKTKQLTASGYLSQTREAVTFKYESSDNSVATVDENGLVTAVGAGEATITATSADDGDNVTAPLTTTVTVTDPTAYTVTYDIAGTMSKYGMDKNAAEKLHMASVKYLHTNGFFQYVEAYPTLSGSGSYEYHDKKTVEIKNATSYLTLKINVPYDGNYKLSVNHNYAKNGGYVDVLIGNEYKGSYDCYASSQNFFGTNTKDSVLRLKKDDGTLGEEAIFHLTAGEHTIKFANRSNASISDAIRGSVGTFKLIKGGSDAVKVMHDYATVSNSNGVPVTSLTNGDTATA